jgi:hypothetical protein
MTVNGPSTGGQETFRGGTASFSANRDGEAVIISGDADQSMDAKALAELLVTHPHLRKLTLASGDFENVQDFLAYLKSAANLTHVTIEKAASDALPVDQTTGEVGLNAEVASALLLAGNKNLLGVSFVGQATPRNLEALCRTNHDRAESIAQQLNEATTCLPWHTLPANLIDAAREYFPSWLSLAVAPKGKVASETCAMTNQELGTVLNKLGNDTVDSALEAEVSYALSLLDKPRNKVISPEKREMLGAAAIGNDQNVDFRAL